MKIKCRYLWPLERGHATVTLTPELLTGVVFNVRIGSEAHSSILLIVNDSGGVKNPHTCQSQTKLTDRKCCFHGYGRIKITGNC